MPQLDLLRAIAVLLVVGSHVTYNSALSRFGWTGVDLFFVLSGFLVSGLLFRDYRASGQIGWSRFIVRRGLKIYPAYYFLMLATVCVCYCIKQPIAWRNLWPDLFFLQDYWHGSWGHLWTLGIEEQFYFLLPLCLWLMVRGRGRRPLHSLLWLCPAVAVSCLLLRWVWFETLHPFDHYTHIRPAHLRLDSLFFGVLLRYLKEFRPAAWSAMLYGHGRFLLALSVVCILPALFFEQSAPFMYICGLSLLYLGYGGILVYAVSFLRCDGAFCRLLCRIGESSYSIYLWHLAGASFCVAVLQNHFHWGRNAVFVTYVAVSIALGIALAHAIEIPILRLRDRFLPPAGSDRAASRATAPALVAKEA